jgi:glucan phosphoethanolaminetransferase (alkaline phosphatase superfamily)
MNQTVALLALLLIAYSVVMMRVVAGFPSVPEPVLTVELGSTGAELSKVLNATNQDKTYDARKVLRLDTHLDNFYIPVYAGFLFALALLIGQSLKSPAPGLVWAACLIIVAAAIADWVENYNIFAALNASTISDATALAIRHPSLVKWFCLAVDYVLLAVMLIKSTDRPFPRIAALLLALVLSGAAAFGFAGLFQRSYMKISTGLFALVPVACAVLLCVPRKQT